MIDINVDLLQWFTYATLADKSAANTATNEQLAERTTQASY